MTQNRIWTQTILSLFKFIVIFSLFLTMTSLLYAQEDTSPITVPSATEETMIAHGRYLVTASNCYGCHTNESAYPYAGGNAFTTPFGTLYSANITPDKVAGIGSLNDDQFYNILHNGKNKNGERLYPIMPYDSYTLMTREDVTAIKAYLFSQQAIRYDNKKNSLRFPFNMRWILGGWNVLNLKKGEFKPDASKTEVINRGAYLATALGHCGACHTPRTLSMGSEHKMGLSGGIIATGWYAPNITPDVVSGIGRWSDEELLQYFTTGQLVGKANATGPMASSSIHSLSHLSESDIKAIIAWLRDQQPIRNKADQVLLDARAQFEWGKPQDFSDQYRQTIKDYSAAPSAINTNIEPERFYYGACATCHGIDGQGVRSSTHPSLVRNSTLGRTNAYNVALVILNGSYKPTMGTHKEVLMPSFKDQFNDEEIAALTNWLFKNYGRPEIHITQDEVSKLRLGKTPIVPPVISIAKSISIAALALVVIFILGAVIRYSPRIKAAFGIGKRKKTYKNKEMPNRTTTFVPKNEKQSEK